MASMVTSKVEGTRVKILEAAGSVLREQGYAGLTTRAVANMAGVPMSQLHYHFGSRQGLLLGLFASKNEQLLDRQQRMFEDRSLPLSKQWDIACAYLEEDLASGYVRILHELWAAGWSNPEIANVVRAGIKGWHNLLAAVMEQAFARHGSIGSFTPQDIAALVGCAFIGAESHILLGFEEGEIPVRTALRRVGDAIRLLENEKN